MDVDEQFNDYLTRKSDKRQLVFGQMVIGPPGCGKSTFCKTMFDLMKNLGEFLFIKHRNKSSN